MAAPTRVVTDTMAGMTMPDVAAWSPAVTVVLGQNPGPFTGPGTNTYLVGTGRRPLLIDTGQGTDAYGPLLARACREDRPVDGLDAIVLTHGHPDHVGGVAQVRALFGDVPVRKMPWPGCDAADLAFEALADGDVVATEGATLQAVWTPGHARDHLCYWLAEEQALFTGDVVLGAGTTVIPDDGDLGDYLDSLRRLLALDAAVIYPAHGPAIREPRAKIEQYLAHRALREEQVLGCLDAGIGAVPAMVARLYADVPQALHFAAAMSVRAHLRKLERDGVAARDGDQWRRVGA
jgi:glyoxylase-like metal-dependent hydrolase (beta-lactamase superfamily II)